MSIRLDGTNPLSYMGVTPVSPPQFEVHNRAPTANDTQNFNLGTIWLERDTENFWILSSLTGGVAVWTPFSNGADEFVTDVGGPAIPINGVLNVLGEAGTMTTLGVGNTIFIGPGGGIALTYETDNGDVQPINNIVQVLGGDNINTQGATNILIVNLNNSIILPATTADELSGVISIGAGPFVHAYGTDNAFFGLDAGNFTLTTALRNSALGKEALSSLTDGDDNLALGAASLTNLTTGSRNFAAGSGAMGLATSASDNVAIGHLALDNLLTGTANICIGEDAGDAYIAAESSNILIANDGIAAESNTIRIGTDGSGVGEQNRTFIAGTVTTARSVTLTTGNLNLPATNTAGTSGVITSNGNNFISAPGNGAAIFIGFGAGNTDLTGATDCIGIGSNTLQAIAGLAFANVAIGQSAMMNTIDSRSVVAIGHAAIQTGLNNDNCVAVGYNSLSLTETGIGNTGLGSGTLSALTLGYSDNTAVGAFALQSNTSGERNTALGWSAGQSFNTNESDNISIGYGSGLLNDQNTLRIGDGTGAGDGQLNRAFIHGIRGITTGVADAVAVLIDSAGQLGTVSSSARYKENITDMADASDAIMNLRPVAFNYKTDSTKSTVYGLIAEEVAEVLPYLAVKDAEGSAQTVKYHELPVLLLNEMIKMKKEIEELRSRL